jgi:RNA polymerase sigma-70 factor, ECF subfamily
MALDGVFREHWARVLGTLVGILGDIELAEDAAQEAFAIAAERWPRDGEPDNPNLVFNAGWGGGRVDLATEAIQLGRALSELMPDEGEVLALLALMLLHDARRDARIRDGEIVLLDDQDRALWDDQQISEGRELLQQAITRGETGSYAVQAAIADLHLQQPRGWRQIAALYTTLSIQTGSPVVELNRAIAVAELDGPEAGLAILDGLELDYYRYFHSARAELLRRAGRDDEARHAYRRALELAQTDAERRSLNDQLTQLSSG